MAITLTLYDYLLMLDHEVRRLSSTLQLSSPNTSTVSRFGTCGEVAKHSVRFVIRADRIESTDERTL